MPAFRLLVLADLHYSPQGEPVGARQRALGCELARRAIEDARRRGGFDAVALTGDLLDDGTLPGAADAIGQVRDEIAAAVDGAPVLVVPGNHDGDPQRLWRAFDTRPGLHEIGGYRFVVFADKYGVDNVCARGPAGREMLAEAAARPGGPIVAIQHNPLSPQLDCSDYPYMPTDRDAVMADYARSGVLLSLSGHYHPGQPLNTDAGVHYYTAPVLCEPPFRYALVTLAGRDVAVDERTLELPDAPAVFDCHCHTEFAYCASTITAGAAVERGRQHGLAGLCLAEHAPQLYCQAETFWNGGHIRKPELWQRAAHSRMAAFRQAVTPLADDRTWLALEVELDCDGRLTLHDEDRDWPDTLIGAIHWLPAEHDGLDDAELASLFLRTSEAILSAGVDVLAHPWRFFGRAGRDVPTHLYPALADALATTETAAEVNWHTHVPDPAFFAECIDRGVRIALGTDSHALWEAGLMAGHLEVVRRAAGRSEVAGFLWRPPVRPAGV